MFSFSANSYGSCRYHDRNLIQKAQSRFCLVYLDQRFPDFKSQKPISSRQHQRLLPKPESTLPWIVHIRHCERVLVELSWAKEMKRR